MGIRDKLRRNSPSENGGDASAYSSRPSAIRSSIARNIPSRLVSRQRQDQSPSSYAYAVDETDKSQLPVSEIESEAARKVSLDYTPATVTSVERPAEMLQASTSPPTVLGVGQPSFPPVTGANSDDPIASNEDGRQSLLPTFRRRRPLIQPVVSETNIPQYSGAVLTDGFVVFAVPDGWQATRVDHGFRLTSGACIGYLCAVAAEEASLALCNTSRLAILGAFDVSTSPVVDRHPDLFVMLVEYRNHGAGRGIALVEPKENGGAVVFGLSGPSSSDKYIEETEQQLLSSAFVARAPTPKITGETAGIMTSESSPPWEARAKESYCIVM